VTERRGLRGDARIGDIQVGDIQVGDTRVGDEIPGGSTAEGVQSVLRARYSHLTRILRSLVEESGLSPRFK